MCLLCVNSMVSLTITLDRKVEVSDLRASDPFRILQLKEQDSLRRASTREQGMERVGSSVRKGESSMNFLGRGGGAAVSNGAQLRLAAAIPGSPSKVKFKLGAGLPLATKEAGRQTKPKAPFLQTLGAAASVKKSGAIKPRELAPNSFLRPPDICGASVAPKMRSAFNFGGFQSKAKPLKTFSGDLLQKKASQPFSSGNLLKSKSFVSGIFKKSGSLIKEGAEKAGEGPLTKTNGRGCPPFAVRASSKSSVSKKAKTAEPSFSKSWSATFSSTSGRGKTQANKTPFAFTAPPHKRGNEPNKQAINSMKSGSFGEIKRAASLGDNLSRGRGQKFGKVAAMNEGSLLKKRVSSMDPPMATGPATKKSKRLTSTPYVQDATRSAAYATVEMGATLHAIPVTPDKHFGCVDLSRPATTASASDQASSAKAMSATAIAHSWIVPQSPLAKESREIIDDGEEELAIVAACDLDDAAEAEFLSRFAVTQGCIDRIGGERKQLRSRLLETHADVSESLLDAMTDLMAEEGDIGIDKLDVDINLEADGDMAATLTVASAIQGEFQF